MTAADQAPTSPTTLVVALSGPLGPDDVPDLCASVQRSLAGRGAQRLVCDMSAVHAPDLALVDALARLVLLARRSGVPIRFRHTSGALRDLVALCGLDDAISVLDTS